jgi:hypothetical protein
MKGPAPKTRNSSDHRRIKRFAPGLFMLIWAFISPTSTLMAADYDASNGDAATNVPWMVEDQQSATNWDRRQDSDVRPPQASLPKPEPLGNSQVEQWSGHKKRLKNTYQEAFNTDPAVRKPDRFVDNPQLDTDGVRHFSNGKHFDLSKISIDQAVDTANASTLGNRPQQDHGNRRSSGNQFNGGMASSSFAPAWGPGGSFGNASSANFGNGSSGNFGNGSNGNFGNGSSGNFGNGSNGNFGNGSSGNFANGSSGNFGNASSGNFGNRRGQFSNSGPMTMAQRMQRREARRLARMIRNY